MAVTLFGLDQTGNNNRVSIDDSTAVSVAVGSGPSDGFTVRTRYEQALWDGRAFSAGTGVQRISDRQVLSMIFANPSDSGRNAFIVLRVAGGNHTGNDAPLSAGFVNNPAPISGGTSPTPSNLKTGAGASEMEFTYATQTERINTDPPTEGEPLGFFVPTGGNPYRIETVRIVGPGESTGIFIRGQGAVGNDSAFISFVWYEEDV